MLADHQAADVLEPWQRHVERIVDEDDVPDIAARMHGVELALDRVEPCQRELAGACRIVAEGALERTAAGRPGLQRRPQIFPGERQPIDVVLVQAVVLRLDSGRENDPVVSAVVDVGNAPEVAAVAQPPPAPG